MLPTVEKGRRQALHRAATCKRIFLVLVLILFPFPFLGNSFFIRPFLCCGRKRLGSVAGIRLQFAIAVRKTSKVDAVGESNQWEPEIENGS